MAGHCGAAAEALEILKETPVDVILLDNDLGDDHGAQFLADAFRAGYRGKTLMVAAGMSAAESSQALKLVQRSSSYQPQDTVGETAGVTPFQQTRSSRPTCRSSRLPRMVSAMWRESKKVRARSCRLSAATASMLSMSSSSEKKRPK